MALLGLSFACCALLLAGLPPLSGLRRQVRAARARCSAPDAGVRRTALGAARAADRCRDWRRSSRWPAPASQLLGVARAQRAARARDRDGAGRRCCSLAVPRRSRSQAGPVMRYMQDDRRSRCTRRAATSKACSAPRIDESAWLPLSRCCRCCPAWRCGCCSTSRSRPGDPDPRRASLALGGRPRCAALQPPQGPAAASGAPSRSCSWLVLADIVRSNIAVARIVLRPRRAQPDRPGFVDDPARAARSRRRWPCWPASSPRRRAPPGWSYDADASMLTDPRPRPRSTRRLDPHHQGPLRAAAAGDLRMSATLLDWPIVIAQVAARARHGLRRVPPAARAARAGPRARARHALRQRHAAAADLRHPRRQHALLRGGAGHRHARLRLHRGARQVPACAAR